MIRTQFILDLVKEYAKKRYDYEMELRQNGNMYILTIVKFPEEYNHFQFIKEKIDEELSELKYKVMHFVDPSDSSYLITSKKDVPDKNSQTLILSLNKNLNL